MDLPPHTIGMIDRAAISVKLGEITQFGDTTEFLIEECGEPTDHCLIPNDRKRFPFGFHMNEHQQEELGALVVAKPELDLADLGQLLRSYFELHETEVQIVDHDGNAI